MFAFIILAILILTGIFYPPILIIALFIAFLTLCFVPTPKPHCGKLQKLKAPTRAEEENVQQQQSETEQQKLNFTHEDFKDDDFYNPKHKIKETDVVKTTLNFRQGVTDKNSHPQYQQQLDEMQEQKRLSTHRTKKNKDFVKELRKRNDDFNRRWALSARPDPNIIQYYTPEHVHENVINGASEQLIEKQKPGFRGFNAKK